MCLCFHKQIEDFRGQDDRPSKIPVQKVIVC